MFLIYELYLGLSRSEETFDLRSGESAWKRAEGERAGRLSYSFRQNHTVRPSVLIIH